MREQGTCNEGIKYSNNIGVDPKVVCHTERSEPTVDARRGQSQVSLFSALLRSFTFVQDDKLTQKMKHGSTATFYYIPIIISGRPASLQTASCPRESHL